MSEEVVLAASASYQQIATTKRRDRFFWGMSGALLLVLLTGFAPTLYMRAFFDVPPIPFYLHVHGAVVTSWFVWLVFQATLVNIQRSDLHRLVGFAGLALAAAVVIGGPMATLYAIPRLSALGVVDIERDIYFLSWVVWLNSAMVFSFLIFLIAALNQRRRPEIHKRLMILASISLIPPALARIANWPAFGWIEEIPFTMATWLLLLVPLVVHDLIVDKRVNKATVIGSVYLVLTTFAVLVIAGADFAQDLVRRLA